MEIRVVLKRLVTAAVVHIGEKTVGLERNVGGFEKRQREKIYDKRPEGKRWRALASHSLVVLADCLAVLGKEVTVSDGQRLRWMSPAKGSDHVEG